MTEEEAKTKWCPFARVAGKVEHGESGPYNREEGNEYIEEANCIGEECMAWRGSVFTGYCGLAGKPK